MSLILEALNKAENERNGEAAQLAYTKYSLSDDSRKWHIPLTITVVVIILAVIALSLPPSTTIPGTDSLADTAGHELPKGKFNKPKTTQPEIIATQQTASPAVSVIKNEELTSLNQYADTAGQTRLQTIALQTPPNNAEIELPSEFSNTNRQTTTSKPAIQAPHFTQSTKTSISTNSTITSVINSQQKADSQAINDKYQSAPIFQNLPAAIKSQLPDLELNIHVYSTNPAKSFVYINSKRYREGATIENSVTLKKITSSGVILMHDETLFRLIIET
jgi:hypothetical protein